MRNLKNVVNNIVECIPEDFNPMLKNKLLTARTDLENFLPEFQVDLWEIIEDILDNFIGCPQFIDSNRPDWVKKIVKIWNSDDEFQILPDDEFQILPSELIRL